MRLTADHDALDVANKVSGWWPFVDERQSQVLCRLASFKVCSSSYSMPCLFLSTGRSIRMTEDAEAVVD